MNVAPHHETQANSHTSTIVYAFNEMPVNPDESISPTNQTARPPDKDETEAVQYNDFELSLIAHYAESFSRIVGSLIRKGAQPADAEDIAQEAFLVAWQKRRALEKDPK
ncbi:MAG TPA: hypothetical protein VF733_05630, partial [Candidatus Saccharimonadales bacterium]